MQQNKIFFFLQILAVFLKTVALGIAQIIILSGPKN